MFRKRNAQYGTWQKVSSTGLDESDKSSKAFSRNAKWLKIT